MTKLTLDAFQAPLDAEDLADRLEFIAGQLRDGYTSGDGGGVGWWTVEDLKEDAATPVCVWYADDPERGGGWFFDTAEDHGGGDRISPQGPHGSEIAAKGAAYDMFGACEFTEGVPDYYDDSAPPYTLED